MTQLNEDEHQAQMEDMKSFDEHWDLGHGWSGDMSQSR